MNGLGYAQQVEAGLPAAGYEVLGPTFGPGSVLGYRSDFRWRWMASKLHLFVAVSSLPVVTADDLTGFAEAALEHARVAKGQLRGAQSGVAAIAALAGARIEPDAEELARRHVVKGFAAFAWPVAVDLSAGRRISHEGRPLLGAFFTSWLRSQVAATLPVPAADRSLVVPR